MDQSRRLDKVDTKSVDLSYYTYMYVYLPCIGNLVSIPFI